MKNLRSICRALALVVALSAPAFAGDIQTGAPTPPPADPAQTVAANGDIQTGVTGPEAEAAGGEATAAGSAAEIALSLLQGVLSLL